jgi:hypothetical protein
MHPVRCLCLGEKPACLEGIAAPGHRRQPQVGDHRVKPHQRPARRPRPVPAEFRARGAPNVVIGHGRQHDGRRPPHHGEAMPYQLGSRHSGQDALDQRAVGPCRMQRAQVGEPGHVDIHAAEVEALGQPVVQLAVQSGQDFLPRLGDRTFGQRDQIDVADTGDVVARRNGTGHQQVGHPSEGGKTIREIADGRRHWGRCCRRHLRHSCTALTGSGGAVSRPLISSAARSAKASTVAFG